MFVFISPVYCIKDTLQFLSNSINHNLDECLTDISDYQTAKLADCPIKVGVVSIRPLAVKIHSTRRHQESEEGQESQIGQGALYDVRAKPRTSQTFAGPHFSNRCTFDIVFLCKLCHASRVAFPPVKRYRVFQWNQRTLFTTYSLLPQICQYMFLTKYSIFL